MKCVLGDEAPAKAVLNTTLSLANRMSLFTYLYQALTRINAPRDHTAIQPCAGTTRKSP